MKPHKAAERIVRNAIENLGYMVHDADVLFGANCPNIDLVVFGKNAAKYIQVKLSSRPATKNGTGIDGSPWTKEQLFGGAPIFNKHDEAPRAHLIVIAYKDREGSFTFYVVPPGPLTRAAVPIGRAFARKRKQNGEERKMFRKEMPLADLKRYKGAWRQLGEPLVRPAPKR